MAGAGGRRQAVDAAGDVYFSSEGCTQGDPLGFPSPLLGTAVVGLSKKAINTIQVMQFQESKMKQKLEKKKKKKKKKKASCWKI